MKVGFFILFGVIMLVLSLAEVFFLNGGSLFEKDEDGYTRFRLKGGIDAMGWAKILCLSIGTGLIASIASAAAWLGLIAFVVMLFVMVYITFWCQQEASAPKEIAIFILMLIVLFIIARMGVIAMGGIVRHAAWLSVFKTVPAVELAICITVILVSVLRYRADGLHLANPRSQKEDMKKLYSGLALLVGAIGVIVAIVLFITGIYWKGF